MLTLTLLPNLIKPSFNPRVLNTPNVLHENNNLEIENLPENCSIFVNVGYSDNCIPTQHQYFSTVTALPCFLFSPLSKPSLPQPSNHRIAQITFLLSLFYHIFLLNQALSKIFLSPRNNSFLLLNHCCVLFLILQLHPVLILLPNPNPSLPQLLERMIPLFSYLLMLRYWLLLLSQ